MNLLNAKIIIILTCILFAKSNIDKIETIIENMRFLNNKSPKSNNDSNYLISTFLENVSSSINSLYNNKENKFFRNSFLYKEDDEMTIEERIISFANRNIVKFLVENPIEDVFNKISLSFPQKHFLCVPCHYFIRNIQKITNNKEIENRLLVTVIDMCSLFLDKQVCHDIIYLYAPTVLEAISSHYINSEFFCGRFNFCPNKLVILKAEDYAKEIFKDKPKIIPHDFSDDKPIKFLHITDTHVDPDYKINSETDCAKPLCCRDPSTNKTKEFAGKWGFSGLCDIPDYTLKSILKSSSELKPDFIIWTGDNAPHDVWEITKETPIISTNIVSNILKETFKCEIFPSIGNHEGFPVDMLNIYNNTTKNSFFKEMSNIYSSFIGEEKAKDFAQNGFYTKLVKGTKLKIISFNCFLCDSFNFFLIRNPTDPLNQIELLRYELDLSEKSGEKVIIIGHIPPGDYGFFEECNKRYNILIERYENIIKGQFFGHTHFDEIRLQKDFFNNKKIIGAVYTAPSVTTYSYMNPSIRLYEMDSKTYSIKNYKQYRVYIEEANKSPEKEPELKLSYDMNSIYGVKNIYDYDIISFKLKTMLHDKVFYNKILSIFTSESSFRYNLYIKKKQMEKYLYERFTTSTFLEYIKRTNYKTFESADYGVIISNIMAGKWFAEK